ncbi:20beta-hydroxysteroid dehydrogenase [Fusarium subglutinans]|uniref:20beta-hydroxysteroid dehydrogenase n=1 Tax=Gibberella subglutinans TaxID=42677 RepID=A0A8H5Q0M2_GIBSU|nr:20beta-hydroxysteroid dehydrogenase [Fusarium subglutinans]KAF5606492.1 20beta-hydroxysteroid dehydrogenase [Fusarium subglutinans]
MTLRTLEKAFSSGVAVITGAGGGLGSGLARHIASFGMTVIIADIDLKRAEEVASDIIAAKGNAEARAIDVSRPEELDALAEYVHTRYGDVQLLINNAAIETLGLLNTGIFDHAKHDTSTVDLDWEKHRKSMAELAREKGMGIYEASRIIVEQIAEGSLWVCTHPAILTEILQQRIQYYEGQEEPNVPPT